LLFDGAAELKAVATRHQEIANDHIRPFLHGDVEADFAIRSFEDLPALSFEQFGEGVPKSMIVIDQ
jgi:hypothetical protein